MTAHRKKIQAMMTCEQCGRVTERLAVHHIRPVENGRTATEKRQLCFDEHNLQVLCYECHSEIHKAMRSRTREYHQKAAKQRAEQALQRIQDADFGEVVDF